MDLVVQARAELERRFYIKPPPGYKIRLLVQISLCSFLILQCCIYLFIWIRDARTRGKSILMFRLQKTQGGRMITVQALYAYVWGILLSSTILLIGRIFLLKSYYLGGSNENAMVWSLFALTPAVLGVLAYTFSNFKAALLLARKDTVVLWSSLSTTWVWMHNLFFLTAVAGWCGWTVPLVLQANSASNNVSKLTAETSSLLDKIIDDPSQLDMAVVIKLQNLQTALLSGADRIISRISSCLAVCVVYCAFYTFAGCFTLVFVHNLRKHLKTMSHGPGESGDGSVEMSRQYRGSSAPHYVHSASHHEAGRITEPFRVARGARTNEPDRDALEKLVSDLTLSVPILLIMCLYYPIAGGLSVKWGSEPIWGWREFTSDIYAWPVILLNIIILGFFTFNSWRKSGRYGASSDNPDSGNGRLESGSTGPAYFPPTAWKVPQSGSLGQVQVLGQGPSSHIVHVTTKEIGKEDM